jgi:hypothetical protein
LTVSATATNAAAREPSPGYGGAGGRGYFYLAHHGGFEDLSAEERERVIQNYREYKQLPRNQRRRMKDRYRQWQEMPPEKRQKLKKLHEREKHRRRRRRD